MPASLFQSFMMGGFECSTHRRRDGLRIDALHGSRHDQYCVEDYQLLAQAGVRTVRDGLRWHLIESEPGSYDWSSFLPMLRAANATKTQVIWDLCHWGLPEWLDPFSAEFPQHFAAFAAAAARLVRDTALLDGATAARFYCPINEISFWSWVGGDVEHFHPYGNERGLELKLQLVRASIAAIRAIRVVDAEARFVQAEPVIHISAVTEEPDDIQRATHETNAQFEAWDLLAGQGAQALGGGPDTLDLLGVNYYWNNQWDQHGVRTPLGHMQHRPLHTILLQLWQRYQRPMLITESGAEEGATIGWLGYVMAEVRQALRMGVPVMGVCLYPVMDYPGWDDERHCGCGLIEVAADWQGRRLRSDVCAEVQLQERIMEWNPPLL